MFKKELGRSMIEMLAVLAVIGILSIGAVAGYNYAMRSWYAEKILNDVGTLGSTIQLRGRGYEKGKEIPIGIFEHYQVKQIGHDVSAVMDNPKTGGSVQKDTFRVQVHAVDWRLCRVTLNKAEGLRKWQNGSTRHNSLIIATGVVNGSTMDEVNLNGSNIDDLCGSSGHKTLAFRFELYGTGAVRQTAAGGITGGSGSDNSGSGEQGDGGDGGSGGSGGNTGETGGNSGNGGQGEGNDGGGQQNAGCGKCQSQGEGGCVAVADGWLGQGESQICCHNGVKIDGTPPVVTDGEGRCYYCGGLVQYVGTQSCCIAQGRQWACEEVDTGDSNCCCLLDQVVENHECHDS